MAARAICLLAAVMSFRIAQLRPVRHGVIQESGASTIFETGLRWNWATGGQPYHDRPLMKKGIKANGVGKDNEEKRVSWTCLQYIVATHRAPI